MEGASERRNPGVVRATGGTGMKAVFTILAHRGQAGAGGRNQAPGRASAADKKPLHDRSAERFRSIWTVRGFLLVQIAIFVVLVSIHFGLLIGGYGHRAAGTTELVIAALLVFGLLLTWTPSRGVGMPPPPRSPSEPWVSWLGCSRSHSGLDPGPY